MTEQEKEVTEIVTWLGRREFPALAEYTTPLGQQLYEVITDVLSFASMGARKANMAETKLTDLVMSLPSNAHAYHDLKRLLEEIHAQGTPAQSPLVVLFKQAIEHSGRHDIDLCCGSSCNKKRNLDHLIALEIGTEMFYQEIVNLGSQVVALHQENQGLKAHLNSLGEGG
ncbi:hypothetical protein D3C85_894240 [compost metagenome]